MTGGPPPGSASPLDAALAHYRAGRLADAAAVCADVLGRNPRDRDALHLSGAVALAQGDAAEAARRLSAAAEAGPPDAELLLMLGHALLSAGRGGEAIAAVRRATAADPRHPGAWTNLGGLLLAAGDAAAAADAYRRGLDVAPGSADLVANLGGALRASGRGSEALDAYGRALAIRPDHRTARLGLATTLKQLGRAGDAEGAFRDALQREPASVDALYGLAFAKRFGAGDPDIAAIEVRLAAARNARETALLNFALGKAYDDAGDAERAFPAFAAGNRAWRSLHAYDAAAAAARTDAIVETFDRALFERLADAGDGTRRPIFVVGMPRSGTTLVEQVLASHEDVFGAGEIEALPRAAHSLGAPFPSGVGGASADSIRALAGTYLAGVETGPFARFTDKLPANYLHIGLIHLAMPNAAIVHCRREAADTCFSCYTTLFERGHSFAYGLDDLAHHHRLYERVMRHWESVLPGRVLDVDYERLVADPEPEIRRLLDHCGLAWDPRCLDFHRTERQVETASSVQVRQPLYATSVGRWRPYARHLGPLLAGLGIEAPA